MEHIDALEEERTLFRIEDRKTLIRRRNGCIGLDLRKVRIVCKVERDRRRYAEFCGKADIGFDAFVHIPTVRIAVE